MSLPNFYFGSTARTTQAPTVRVPPNHPAITVSDHFIVSQTAERLRFTRAHVDGQGFNFAAPNARVRFRTSSDLVLLHLEQTGLITREDTYEGVGTVWADGVVIGTFDAPRPAQAFEAAFYFSTSVSRQIEVEWPLCAAVDLRGVTVREAGVWGVSTPRTGKRYVAFGDSITHGIPFVTRPDLNWPARVAARRGWRLYNDGWGGRQCDPNHATQGASVGPEVATYLIGFNEFYPQTPLATFRARYNGFLANFRAAAPSCPLLCITPLWTPYAPGEGPVVAGSNAMEAYRQVIRDAVTAFGDPLTKLAEGEAMATNNLSHFPDGIHPTDAACAQIDAAVHAALLTHFPSL